MASSKIMKAQRHGVTPSISAISGEVKTSNRKSIIEIMKWHRRRRRGGENNQRKIEGGERGEAGVAAAAPSVSAKRYLSLAICRGINGGVKT
jgi:hypothetical protein